MAFLKINNLIRLFKNILNLKKIYLEGRLKLYFTFASLIFIGFSISNNLDKLLDQRINGITFVILFFSYLITSLSIFLNATAWKYFLNWLECESKNISFVPLFLKTNILKYLPGGIWHLAERLILLKAEIPLKKSILAVFLEPFLMLAAAFFLIAFGNLPLPLRLLCLLPAFFFHIKLRKFLINLFERLIPRKLERINSNYSFDEYSLDFSLGRKPYPFRAFFMVMKCWIIP